MVAVQETNKNVQTLINELNKVYKNQDLLVKTRKFEVSPATSWLSTVYERVRNTVDYKDEHLIRRYAIHRFLRVYLNSRSESDNLTDLLVKDLIRGKYVQDGDVTDWKLKAVTDILNKYIVAKQYFNDLRITKDPNILWDWIIGVASSEIEKAIDPFYKPEVFIKVMSQHVLEALRETSLDLSPEQEGLHVFIACHRALVKSDLPVLRYHALSIVYPNFFDSPTFEQIKQVVTNIESTREYIDGIIKSPTQDRLYVQIRKLAPPFKVLEGVLESNPERIEPILSNEETLLSRAEEFISQFYVDLKKKLNLRITRMLIYLFITKMLLALVIEAPVDLYLYGHINYLTLAINTLFPVAVFFIIAKKIRIQGRDNTDRIFQAIKKIVYEDKIFITEQEEAQFKKRVSPIENTQGWLWYVYASIYLLVYGVIFLVLNKLGFNLSSVGIFIFFVSVLSFFAWNIRARSLELQYIPKKEKLFDNIINILALPVLKLGQKLSTQVSRFNFFTLIFDFIFEAPFKIIVQSVEDIIDFFRRRHEEVVEG